MIVQYGGVGTLAESTIAVSKDNLKFIEELSPFFFRLQSKVRKELAKQDPITVVNLQGIQLLLFDADQLDTLFDYLDASIGMVGVLTDSKELVNYYSNSNRIVTYYEHC